MKRLAIATLIALAGCGWIVKHPPVAAGIAGVTMGFASCEIGNVDVKTCALVGGAAGAGLAVIALVVTLVANAGESAPAEAPPARRGPRIIPLYAPPDDAGVSDGAALDAPAAPPAPPPDAGVADAAIADAI
jgi:hypothetical protein